MFNISCTGKRNVIWAEPLPKNTFVYPGYYTATLFIYNATVENTNYYMCTYESQDEQEGRLDEENEAGIYVFVPGEYNFLLFEKVHELDRMWKQNRVWIKSNFSVLLAHSDPDTPFVPETPENLVVPMDTNGVPISCRVSDPHSHVILRSVPSGEEMSAFYDNKMGFFGSLSPGQYRCETTVNGQTARSVVYTVESDGESR